VRRWIAGRSIRAKFRRHQALIAASIPDLNDLPWAKFRKAEAPKRFHVDENVLRSRAPREKAEALQAVEPLYHRTLPITFGRNMDMGPLWELRRMYSRAFVHLYYAKSLKAPVAP
jgi:hypothetical protein